MRPIRRNYPTYNNWWYADRRYWMRKVKEMDGEEPGPEPEEKVMFASNVFELPNFQLTPISNANTLYRYNRWEISVGMWPVRKARFLITNVNVSTNNVVPNPDPIIFEGLFLEINGTPHPIKVGGETEFTVAPGAAIWTDPLDVTIPTDAPLYMRSARRFVLNQKWTGTSALISTQLGDYAQHSGSSLLATAAGPAPSGVNQEYSPRPPIVAMVGCGYRELGPVPLVVGSSGAYGVGWNTRLTAPRREVGYLRNAFGASANERTTSMIAATSGGTTSNTINSLLPYLAAAFAQLPNRPFNCVYSQLGLNDLGTFTQAKTQVETLRTYLDATFGKIPFIMQTVTPTTSKANPTRWTDEANQGFSNANFGPDPSSRSQLNDWIRTNPAGMTCIDAAKWVEGTDKSKISVPPFKALLTEDAAAEANSIVVDVPPVPGTYLVLKNGATYEKGADRLVSGKVTPRGSGDYIVELMGGDYTMLGEGEVRQAMPAGTEVLSSNTYDGLHFSTECQRQMAGELIKLLGIIPYHREAI